MDFFIFNLLQLFNQIHFPLHAEWGDFKEVGDNDPQGKPWYFPVRLLKFSEIEYNLIDYFKRTCEYVPNGQVDEVQYNHFNPHMRAMIRRNRDPSDPIVKLTIGDSELKLNHLGPVFDEIVVKRIGKGRSVVFQKELQIRPNL